MRETKDTAGRREHGCRAAMVRLGVRGCVRALCVTSTLSVRRPRPPRAWFDAGSLITVGGGGAPVNGLQQ